MTILKLEISYDRALSEDELAAEKARLAVALATAGASVEFEEPEAQLSDSAIFEAARTRLTEIIKKRPAGLHSRASLLLGQISSAARELTGVGFKRKELLTALEAGMAAGRSPELLKRLKRRRE